MVIYDVPHSPLSLVVCVSPCFSNTFRCFFLTLHIPPQTLSNIRWIQDHKVYKGTQNSYVLQQSNYITEYLMSFHSLYNVC